MQTILIRKFPRQINFFKFAPRYIYINCYIIQHNHLIVIDISYLVMQRKNPELVCHQFPYT